MIREQWPLFVNRKIGYFLPITPRGWGYLSWFGNENKCIFIRRGGNWVGFAMKICLFLTHQVATWAGLL